MRLRSAVDSGEYGREDPGSRDEHPWFKAEPEVHGAHGIAVEALAQQINDTLDRPRLKTSRLLIHML